MSDPARGKQPTDPARQDDAGAQLSFGEASGLHRSGFGEVLDDSERERIGAGASGLMVITLLCGLIGLGPVGLVTGAAAMRGQRTSSWIGTIGILLAAVQTTILALALGLAVATG